MELPESAGYDAVMTVVDSVSKRVHFLPTNTTVTAEGATRLFLHHVWKLHGLPNSVVSDRGPQFVAQFTKDLYRLLGIKIAATTAWHPQSDGQTERVNLTRRRWWDWGCVAASIGLSRDEGLGRDGAARRRRFNSRFAPISQLLLRPAFQEARRRRPAHSPAPEITPQF